jgi:hypothetical protein
MTGWTEILRAGGLFCPAGPFYFKIALMLISLKIKSKEFNYPLWIDGQSEISRRISWDISQSPPFLSTHASLDPK